MRTLWLVGLLIVPLLVPRSIQARWESARDNQSPAALAAMSNQELFNEAFDVCVRRALLESFPSATDETRQAIAECNDYLTTLVPVVRERNDGTIPPWMNQIVGARTTAECQDAFETFLHGTEKPTAVSRRKRATAARTPRATAMPKATPVPPRATAMPKATPVPPQATAMPKATAAPPQATAMPEATPAAPRPTAMPNATPAAPLPTAKRQATPSPRSGWSEQLPPWLAPK
jgi:hypothetical protein